MLTRPRGKSYSCCYARKHAVKVTARWTTRIFIFRYCTILGALNFPARECFMMAAAMTNHRHVGVPSLAARLTAGWPRRLRSWCLRRPPRLRSCGAIPPQWSPGASDGTGCGWPRTEVIGMAACRLRFNVFNVEMGEGLSCSYSTGLDRDRFDPVCDHLIVENRGGWPGGGHLSDAIRAHRRRWFRLLQRPGI